MIWIMMWRQWDKVEDKYAVSSLAVAALVGLIACSGVISVSNYISLLLFIPSFD